MSKSSRSSAPALSSVAQVTITEAKANFVSSNENLQALRDASAEAASTDYGANKRYAAILVDTFGREFWRKASPNFKQWQEEKACYDAALKGKNHPNPTVAHNRLIKAANEICNPDKSKGTRTMKALSVRAKDESIALYKAFLKEEAKVGLDDTEKRVFSGLLTFMTESLKIDLNNLDK